MSIGIVLSWKNTVKPGICLSCQCAQNNCKEENPIPGHHQQPAALREGGSGFSMQAFRIYPPPSFVMFILVTKKMCINYFYLWPLMDIQPDLLKSSRTLQCLGRDWGLMIIYDLSLGLGV